MTAQRGQQDSTQGVRGMDVEKVGAEGGSRSGAATADRAASLPDDQGAHDSDEFKSLKLGQTAVKKKILFFLLLYHTWIKFS